MNINLSRRFARSLMWGTAAALLLLAVVIVVAEYRDLRAVRISQSLLDITTGLQLGSSSKREVIALMAAYSKYTIPETQADLEDVITYRVPAIASPRTFISVSIEFTNDKVTGRSVGMKTAGCCSIETRQRLSWKSEDWSKTPVKRSLIGDLRFLTFNMSPRLDVATVRKLFDYQTKCLQRGSHCESVNDLNPEAARMLAESVAAGY